MRILGFLAVRCGSLWFRRHAARFIGRAPAAWSLAVRSNQAALKAVLRRLAPGKLKTYGGDGVFAGQQLSVLQNLGRGLLALAHIGAVFRQQNLHRAGEPFAAVHNQIVGAV